jgi:hypothetical protein
LKIKISIKGAGKIAKNQRKLPKRIKEDIRLRFSVNGETLKDLSEEYGVNYSYISWLSCTEKWALFPQDGNNSEEYKKLYNEALVKKTTEMVDIYGEIIDKAVKLMKKPYTSKDLVNIANVIKIAEQRQFVLLMIREDKDSG